MSANIPSNAQNQSTIPLTPEQSRQLGEELRAVGINLSPKELRSVNMDQLQKYLLAAGKPEAFEKIKKVMKSFSEEAAFSGTTLVEGRKLVLPPTTVTRLATLFVQKFGSKNGPEMMDNFLDGIAGMRPNPDDAPAMKSLLRKQLEQYLVQQEVPQVEAQNIAENFAQGEDGRGLSSMSSGGAETD